MLSPCHTARSTLAGFIEQRDEQSLQCIEAAAGQKPPNLAIICLNMRLQQSANSGEKQQQQQQQVTANENNIQSCTFNNSIYLQHQNLTNMKLREF